MPGRFGQWLQSIGEAFLRAGETVAGAFRSVFGVSEGIAGVQPDAAGLRGLLENEQLVQLAQQQPGEQDITSWLRNQTGEPPPGINDKVSGDIIRQTVGELPHPYQVRLHLADVTTDGKLTREHWITMWYDHRPTPAEIAENGDNYIHAIADRCTGSREPFEYEVWEDRTHADWTM